jgi:hypothetical protein
MKRPALTMILRADQATRGHPILLEARDSNGANPRP